MNRTKIIEHYKEFMQIDEMTEDYQIDIDWVEALIDDYNLVNKNDICQNVSVSVCDCGKPATVHRCDDCDIDMMVDIH